MQQPEVVDPYFAMIMHNMNEGLIVFDPKGRITHINPMAQRLLGITGSVLGKPIWDACRERNILEMYHQIHSDGKPVTREFTVAASAYDPRTLKACLTPVRDRQDLVLGGIGIFSDITGEREADRIKAEFVATTSHELRTPLASIKESVSLVLDQITGSISDEQKRFLTLAKRNIDRLAKVINDLLDLSRLETGKMVLQKTPCRLEELVEETLTSLKLLAESKRITLQRTIPKKLPVVPCDAKRVAQVLTNLVGNAIKFSPPGGVVAVTIQILDRPKTVQIRVTDNGPGIRREDTKKLFQKFGQLDSSMTRKVGGIGLGLSVSKWLVEMQGGKIWVESELGKGASFCFTLPLLPRKSTP